MDITGKVALITGGGSGIGRATALRLAREGAAAVVADVDDEGGRETVRQIDEQGGRAPSAGSGQSAFVRADVTSEDDVHSMVAFVEQTFGGLDILHNNAGITTGRPLFPDGDADRWARVLDINLRGVILGTQYGIRAMRKRGGGAIVSTASMAGIGYGFPPDPVYAASKGGVVLFTASLAPLKDEANIRVNCVCPGVVETPLLYRNRGDLSDAERQALEERLRAFPLLRPEEIADAVVELIRDDTLAGRAMWVRNGVPRTLGPMARPQG